MHVEKVFEFWKTIIFGVESEIKTYLVITIERGGSNVMLWESH